jgi:acyl-[acyl-carrier-protein]-phospholipid O-acyltransferase/long-chain-fatty-acid--[acyl-carrier-protein] ligase
LNDALNTADRAVFVTSVPDEKKGEQLVVLYQPDRVDADRLREIVENSELPNLWRPRPTAYYPVDDFPTIGTGKLDLKKLRVMAEEFVEKGRKK